jgi:hypothetical protein
MADLLSTLAEHYDVVVIDAPPLLPVTDAAVLTTHADGALVVVRHGKTHRDEAERALKALAAVNAKLLGTVLNFAPKGKRGKGHDGYGYDRRPEGAETQVPPAPAARGASRAARGGTGPLPLVTTRPGAQPGAQPDLQVDLTDDETPAAGSVPPAVPLVPRAAGTTVVPAPSRAPDASHHGVSDAANRTANDGVNGTANDGANGTANGHLARVPGSTPPPSPSLMTPQPAPELPWSEVIPEKATQKANGRLRRRVISRART